MKYYTHTLVTLSLLLGCNTSVSAFDLWQAWTAAREYSAQYDAASHQRNASYEGKEQAKAQLLPQISASANYSDQPQSGYDDYRSHGWRIQLNQPLFDKSKWSQYQAEKIASNIADSDFDNTDAELLMQVAKTYLTLLTVEDKLTAVATEKAAYQLQIAQAQALFDAGEATVIESYEAQSGYDAAVAKETDLHTQLVSAQNTLANLTGLTPEYAEPVKNGELPNWLEDISEEQWISLALDSSPILRLRRQQLSKSKADLTAVKDTRLPNVNLNLGYQDTRSNTHYSNGMENHNRGRGAYIGVQFTLPLYTGGQTNSQIRQGKEVMQQQEALLEEAKRQIKLEVKQAYAMMRGKQAQIHAQERLLATNQTKLDSIILGRQYGVRSNMDEIKARQDSALAEGQLAEARYGYIEAYLQLLHACGQLNKQKGQNAVLVLFDHPAQTTKSVNVINNDLINSDVLFNIKNNSNNNQTNIKESKKLDLIKPVELSPAEAVVFPTDCIAISTPEEKHHVIALDSNALQTEEDDKQPLFRVK